MFQKYISSLIVFSLKMASQSELRGVLNVNSSIQTIFQRKKVFREQRNKGARKPFTPRTCWANACGMSSVRAPT